MNTIFIDGSAGTTGLRIYERLEARTDLRLIRLPEDKRKDAAARAEAINSADVAFLCLPDDAAREAVALTASPKVVLIDTSTAHRTLPDWAYGFPELGAEFINGVKTSKRIAVPGCHASGFIALVRPLIRAGLISADTPLASFSLTGYSGGGKKMIADYNTAERSPLLDAPRVYGISQQHKHLKEMQAFTGLDCPPVFLPTVGDFYSGMEVSVPLHASQLVSGKTREDVKAAYAALYTGPIVCHKENTDESGFLAANRLAGLDSMEISVQGNEDRFVLVARYDNLGKGASGAAIQCMNLALGLDPAAGLQLP